MIHFLIIDLFLCFSVSLQTPASPEDRDLLIKASFPVTVQGLSEEAPACVECHGDLVNKGLSHYPAEDACDNCHEATGASHPSDSLGFRLMDSTPALCFYCHEEEAAQAFGHRPYAEGNCLGCHDAHGSAQAALLRNEEEELCLGCHNQVIQGDSSETANISRLVKGSQQVVHSAIAGMGCLICHRAHGSEFRVLLVDAYPEENYVPATTENFGLCFLCHDAGILDEEETEWATGFRNGTRNLHRVHIHGDKGRNCRMCHNLHGSTQLFLMEESVDFGKWEMHLNFVPRERGGSCLPGCHGKLAYTR